MGGGLSETPLTPPTTPSLWVFSALPLKKKMYLFVCGCAGPSLLPGLFSSCGEWGLFSSCEGFSLQWLLLSQSMSFRVLRLQ